MKYFLSILFFWLTTSSFAQIGGSSTYQFLDMTHSSRVASLGTSFLSVNDHDLSLAYGNPALITKEMHNKLTINYLNYFSDINAGFLAYGHHIQKVGTFAAALQFINYGNFTETDQQGNEYGSFKAAEYALTIGWSKLLSENLSVGVNLKNILSQLESYQSYGLAIDLAANYLHANDRFSASMIVANIGRQISTYNNLNEDLPLNIKLGFSNKFEHAPLRLHFLFDNLQQWDLTIVENEAEPEIDPFTGLEIKPKGWAFGDKMMRHVVVGGEFIPGNGNFSIRLGYNYRRRAEMKIASRQAMVGFSWGFGLKISKLHLSYARATYSLAGASNHFTITTKLSDFL